MFQFHSKLNPTPDWQMYVYFPEGPLLGLHGLSLLSFYGLPLSSFHGLRVYRKALPAGKPSVLRLPGKACSPNGLLSEVTTFNLGPTRARSRRKWRPWGRPSWGPLATQMRRRCSDLGQFFCPLPPTVTVTKHFV